jgi:hypothetical protein
MSPQNDRDVAKTVGTRFIASSDSSTGILQTCPGWLVFSHRQFLARIKCVNAVGTRFIASSDSSTGISFVKNWSCLEIDGEKSGIQEKKPRRQRQRIQVNKLPDAINRAPTVFRVFHAPKCVGERGWLVREPFLLWNTRPLSDTFRVPMERGRKRSQMWIAVDKSLDAINRVPTLIEGNAPCVHPTRWCLRSKSKAGYYDDKRAFIGQFISYTGATV